MSAQRTPGGIRYDTKARSTGRRSTDPTPTRTGGSGSEKLAAYKKATSRTSPAQTPEEYRKSVQTPTQTSRPPTDVSPMARAGVPPSPTPTPVTPAQTTHISTDVSPMARAGVSPPSVISYPSQFESVNARFAPQAGLKAEMFEKKREDIIRQSQTEISEAKEGFESYEPIQRFRSGTQDVAGTIRAGVPELVERTGFAGQVLQYPVESTARLIEFGGMIPAGLEVAARRPKTIKPALESAVLMTPSGLTTAAAEEPGQFVSDIATGTLFGYGMGKGFKAIKSKTPAIEFRSTPQDPLIKAQIPEGQPVPKTEIPTFKQAEFLGQLTPETGFLKGLGEPQFKITDVPVGEVITPPKPVQTIPAMVGKTKAGFTDVYFRADKPTIRAFGEQYFGEVTQLKTPEGSFIAFEPTAPKPVPKITPKAELGKLPTTPDALKIGELPDIGTTPRFQTPFRLAQRQNLIKADIELTPQVAAKPGNIFETGAQKQFGLDTKKQIPEWGSLETVPTKEQVGYAKSISKSIRMGDEPKIIEAFEPVFGQMGTSIKGSGVNLKIVSESDMAGSGALGYYEPNNKMIVIPETSSNIGATLGTIGHELGHALAKDGVYFESKAIGQFATKKGIFEGIMGEGIAEASRMKASRIFEKMYGIKADPNSKFGDVASFYRSVYKEEGIKAAVYDFKGDMPHGIGYGAASLINPRYNRLASGYPYDAFSNYNNKDISIKAKRKAAQQQKLIYKPKEETKPLSFAEPQPLNVANIFKSDLQAILDRKPPHDNIFSSSFQKTATIGRAATIKSKSPFVSIIPVGARSTATSSDFAPMPSGITQTDQYFKSMPATKTEPILSPDTKTEPILSPDTKIDTEAMSSSVFEPAFNNLQEQKTKTSTSVFSIPEMPPVVDLNLRRKKDKRKKTKMISKDMFYDVKAPIADWADFFGGFKK